MTEKKSYYVPFQRYEEVSFVEEGMEDEIPFTARIRTNLTFAEVDDLTFEQDDSVRDVIWPKLAPYVVGWNVSGLDEDDNVVPIPAPAEGGPDQFQYIPIQLFWQIFREVKLRNMGTIDPKRKSRPASMAATDGGAK